LISDCGLFDVPGQAFRVFLPTPPLPSTFQPEKSIAQSSFSTHFAIPSQLQLAPTTHAVTTAVKSASKQEDKRHLTESLTDPIDTLTLSFL